MSERIIIIGECCSWTDEQHESPSGSLIAVLSKCYLLRTGGIRWWRSTAWYLSLYSRQDPGCSLLDWSVSVSCIPLLPPLLLLFCALVKSPACRGTNISASSPSGQSAPCSPPEPHPTCFDPVSNSVEGRAESWHLLFLLLVYWHLVRGSISVRAPRKIGIPVITTPVSPVLHPAHRPAVPSLALSSGLTSSLDYSTAAILLPSLSSAPISLLTFSRSSPVWVGMVIVPS